MLLKNGATAAPAAASGSSNSAASTDVAGSAAAAAAAAGSGSSAASTPAAEDAAGSAAAAAGSKEDEAGSTAAAAAAVVPVYRETLKDSKSLQPCELLSNVIRIQGQAAPFKLVQRLVQGGFPLDVVNNSGGSTAVLYAIQFVLPKVRTGHMLSFLHCRSCKTAVCHHGLHAKGIPSRLVQRLVQAGFPLDVVNNSGGGTAVLYAIQFVLR
jgi:hypothetical protein